VTDTGTGDRLRTANHIGISPSHPGHLSLLPYAGREMSPGQSAVTLYGWGVKAGWLVLLVHKRVFNKCQTRRFKPWFHVKIKIILKNFWVARNHV